VIRGHELKHSTSQWYGRSRSSIVEAMPPAVKRAAACKHGKPVDIGSNTEHSCPGDKVSHTTPEEEITDGYRFQTYGNPREHAANADSFKWHLDRADAGTEQTGK